MKDPKRFDGPSGGGPTQKVNPYQQQQQQQAPRHQSWLRNVFGGNSNTNVQQVNSSCLLFFN